MVSDWFSALLGIPESNLFPARNLGEGERWSAVQFQVWSIKTRSANLFHMHFLAVSKILMWKRNCAKFIQFHWSHLEAAPKWVWSGSPGTSCSVPPASSYVKKRLSSSKYFIGHKSNHWFDLYVNPYITAVCLNDVSVTLVVEDVSWV